VGCWSTPYTPTLAPIRLSIGFPYGLLQSYPNLFRYICNLVTVSSHQIGVCEILGLLTLSGLQKCITRKQGQGQWPRSPWGIANVFLFGEYSYASSFDGHNVGTSNRLLSALLQWLISGSPTLLVTLI